MSRNVPHRRNKLVYVDDPSPYSTTMAGDNTAAWRCGGCWRKTALCASSGCGGW